jgi:hypothetical protein
MIPRNGGVPPHLFAIGEPGGRAGLTCLSRKIFPPKNFKTKGVRMTAPGGVTKTLRKLCSRLLEELLGMA